MSKQSGSWSDWTALRAIDLVISSTHDLQVTLNILISQIIKLLAVDAVTVTPAQTRHRKA